MVPEVSGYDDDTQIKIKAMDFILREICRNYQTNGRAVFSEEEVRDWLRSLGKEYLNLNLRHLFRGSGSITINDDYELTLTKEGIKHCNDKYVYQP